LNKLTYQRLIARNINQHVTDFSKLSGYNYQIDESVNEQIYINSVYPTQGTRPVFSSVHMIFSQLLMDITVYCIENDIDKNQNIKIKMHDFSNVSVDIGDNTLTFPILLELNQKRKRGNANLKTMVAVHEAGHALVASLLPNADPVHKISIISRGSAGGYTLKLPTDERRLTNKNVFLDDIAMTFGGYAAEELIVGVTSTGPSSDLEQATAMARAMVTRYGMSEAVGPISIESDRNAILYGRSQGDRMYSEEMNKLIDAEVKRILEECREKARTLVRENRALLDKITNVLIEKENLEREEYESILLAHGIVLKK
jgi:hypothetical protein